MLLFSVLLVQFLSIATTGWVDINADMFNTLEEDTAKYIKEKSIEEIPQEGNILFDTSPTSANLDSNIKLSNATGESVSGNGINMQYTTGNEDEPWWLQMHLREKKDSPVGKYFLLDESADYLERETEDSQKSRPINSENMKSRQDTRPLFALCRGLKAPEMLMCMDTVMWRIENALYSNALRRCVSPCEEVKRSEEMVPGRSMLEMWEANKRLEEEEAKRTKFFSWAGKRNGNIPKRIPFHAWGGKRSNQVGTEKIQASRVPFNAWGGKRAFEFENGPSKLYDLYKRSKNKFHSWGGKRDN